MPCVTMPAGMGTQYACLKFADEIQ
jgi:hypothetical protein